MRKPLCIDVFCGLGGWAEGFLAEGWDVIGFDIENHVYGDQRYPGMLCIQDALTLDGAQFKNADCLVMSPPCQKYSYMAMPWTRSKAMAAAIRADETGTAIEDLNRLFNACFRIQREACEAAGRHIPMIVENVRGAIPWVGRSRWSHGSFHLWGDIPALMPITLGRKAMKRGVAHRSNGATNFHGHSGANDGSTKNSGGSWFNIGSPNQKVTGQNPVHRLAVDGRKHDGSGWTEKGSLKSHNRLVSNKVPSAGPEPTSDGIKCGGDWFGPGVKSAMRNHSSKFDARKAASAMIAKIPLALSTHIARTFLPVHLDTEGAR